MTLTPDGDGFDSSPSHFTDQHYIPESITAAMPLIVTISEHGLSNGQAIRASKFYAMPFAVATGMEQLNNKLFYVQQATTDTFGLYDVNSLPIDGRNYTPYIDGGQFTRTGPTLPVENPAPPPPPGVPDPFI